MLHPLVGIAFALLAIWYRGTILQLNKAGARKIKLVSYVRPRNSSI